MIIPMFVAVCEQRGCTSQTLAYPSRAEVRAAIEDDGWSYSARDGHRCDLHERAITPERVTR